MHQNQKSERKEKYNAIRNVVVWFGARVDEFGAVAGRGFDRKKRLGLRLFHSWFLLLLSKSKSKSNFLTSNFTLFPAFFGDPTLRFSQMAANSGNISFTSSWSTTSQIHGDTDSVQALSPDNEMASDLASSSVCDSGSHTQSLRRRFRGRFRHNSSESVENNLSQQIPHMVNTVRRHQSPAFGEDDQLVDGDNPAWSLQYASTHTTPSGSRRWRQVLSDTDSDGFDNWASLYGENESSVSFRRYRVPHVETDSFSHSAYGGDSDISMDTHSFIGTGIFNLPGEGDDFDSDTDIDPMNAGLSQLITDEDSDEDEDEEEDEEEEEEEDREWELAEAEAEEGETPARLQIFFTSSPSESRDRNNWEQRFNSTESEGMFSQLMRDTWQSLEDVDLPHRANFGDYLDARRFEDLFDHLAENESSRRGAPPASVSFVNNLPRVVIGKEHEKHDELVCAICKDVLAPGTEVNQLPCAHLYHINCILPWLSARNSCPLCRYELPTDDKDYEEGKQNIDRRNVIHERQRVDVTDDSSSDVSDDDEVNEEDGSSQGGFRQGVVNSGSTQNSSATRSGRGRWFFLAAAPIVSLVGIVLVLWLGNNSQIEGSRHLGGHYLSGQNHHAAHAFFRCNCEFNYRFNFLSEDVSNFMNAEMQH
ncbi:E3 ubiquitin-protein ligase RING1-like protein, partial [Mucuna pruriens]